MSFVLDHVKQIDSQLDRLQLAALPVHAHFLPQPTALSPDNRPALRLGQLHNHINTLTITSLAIPTILPATTLLAILHDTFTDHSRHAHSPLETHASNAHDLHHDARDDDDRHDVHDENVNAAYEHELEWILLAKATVQVYGSALDTMIQRTLPLNDEIWYWKNVLASYSYTGLYSIQTSPLRLWTWSRTVFREVNARGNTISDGWQRFYDQVRSVVRDLSVANVQSRVINPLVLVRSELQEKQAALERARLLHASGIGYFLSNGMSSESMQERSPAQADQREQWKRVVADTISMLDAVLSVAAEETESEQSFQDHVRAHMGEDSSGSNVNEIPSSESRDPSLPRFTPPQAAARLEVILRDKLPNYNRASNVSLRANRRPSRLVRYWVPGLLLLASSTTVLRLVLNRKDAILASVRDLGATTMDFWSNWIIDPLRRIIGTIRHDEASEISIMSKKSLEGDRASLERMVVDFAIDNPGARELDNAEIAQVRAGIQEGDLTPVLRVYEKELQSPLYGVIRGDLIRALLIQVQKTKVDVEVAMGGIDSLLKSQELVFGFVGLTPGILVAFGLVRWFRGMSNSRSSLRRGQQQSESLNTLRNIDRILTAFPKSDTATVFKDYGLLVCEAISLREFARKTFPTQAYRDFLQDFDDLLDKDSDVERKLRVSDRIRWAYSRWL